MTLINNVLTAALFCFQCVSAGHTLKENLMNIHELRDALRKATADATAIRDKAAAESREFTDDEKTAADSLIAQIDKLEADIVKADESAQRQSALDARIARLTSAQAPLVTPGYATQSRVPVASDNFIQANKVEFPRRKTTGLRAFSRLSGLTAQEQEASAYKLGIWAAAAMGHKRAQQWCGENGIPLQAVHEESVNTTGGYLVPTEIDNMLIDLREQYGVFRRNARVVPMSTETKNRPRRTGGLTSYFIEESAAITESTKSWDNVNLTAKDLYVISRMSAQVADDAMISLGDDLAGEIAYAFALKEDQCGFLGDGTSTYGGITGLDAKLTAATASLVTGASGTHTNWAGITLANFNSLVGLLPQFAERSPKFYCSKAFYGSVIQRVEYAAGGNSVINMAGGTGRTFLGYPVEIVQVMPASAAAADIVCYLGDLGLAADFGDRRQTSIAFSTDATVGSQSMFERNQIAIRGWERFDINVHDVGNTSSAGPVVALLTAS